MLTLFLAACGQDRTTTNINPSATVEETSILNAYPSPGVSVNPSSESYPAANDIPEPLEPGVLPKVTINMPEPEEGKSAVTGILFSYTQLRVVPKTLFYLTPGFGADDIVPPMIDEPNADKGDIVGFSDSSGNIALSNVSPGTYYLIVMAPYNWSIAELSDRDQVPRKIEVNQGEKIELGVIYLSWP